MDLEKRKCIICGIEYKPKRRRQVTCGNPACQKRQHYLYTKKWIQEHYYADPERYKEYKARLERNRRAKLEREQERLKAEEVAKATPRDHEVSHYAEEQMKKTLELVPKIDINL